MPVEVIISYDEWQEIEHALEASAPGLKRDQLKKYAGALRIAEEPMEYQRRMRGEWK